MAGLAAGIIAPSLGGLAGQKIAAMKTASADRAANLLHGSTQDPQAALAALSKPTEIVPGYTPTTAEATGDIGLAQAQKRAAIASPEFAAQEMQKRSQQNTAQRNLLNASVDASANPLSVPDFFQKRMDAIDQAHSSVISQLEQNAQKQMAAMPDPQAAEIIGNNFRAAVAHAEDAHKSLVNDLYNQVPKDLTVDTSGARDTAAEIQKSIDPKYTIPSPYSAPIIDMAANLEETTPFDKLRQLDSTVTSKMSEAKRAGDNIGYSQLVKIKSAIKDSINNSINEQPTDAPAQLAKANKAYADMAQIYRQNPVASILKTNGFRDQYIANNATVANKIFQPGNVGYENGKAFLTAANNSPDAVQAMKDAAISKLYGEMKTSDVLTPQTLDNWKMKHADALRALDEAAPGFSKSFDNAASATSALEAANSAKMDAIKQAQSGAAGKLLNASSNDEVKSRVGSVLASPDGATQFSALVNQVRSDPAALDGLRRAGIEHLMDKFSNAGVDLNGNRAFSGAKLNAFLRNHSDAAEALFGPDVVANMRAIAADADRTSQMLTATAARNGSDTAKNLVDFIKAARDREGGHSFWSYLTSGATNNALLTSLAIHHPSAYAALSPFIGVGRYVYNKVHAAGIKKTNDLLTEALLDPEKGRAMLQSAIDKSGKPNVASIKNIVNTLTQTLPTAGVVDVGREQLHRASGGRTNDKRNPKAEADRLINMAARIKKEQAGGTSSLLNLDDTTVAKALAVANRNI